MGHDCLVILGVCRDEKAPNSSAGGGLTIRFFVAMLAVSACRGELSSAPRSSARPPVGPLAAVPLEAPGSAQRAPGTWMYAFDLDGDGRNDTVDSKFSGGAHCCYQISVTLTSTNLTIHLPFELDGGYVGGLDLSIPDHFDIRRIHGALPEIMMEIETYNGEPSALPTAWKQRYGISTNHIAVAFPQGQLSVRDVPDAEWIRR